jgi:hypothetical protein
MPADLAALRRQWQACLVQARAALRALAAAERAYVAAYQAAHPAPRPRHLLKSANTYPGA